MNKEQKETYNSALWHPLVATDNIRTQTIAFSTLSPVTKVIG